MGELIDGQPVFPGENEINQLYLIQNLIGKLTPEQHEIFLKNPRFLGTKFPEISKPETIERRYLGKLSKKALNFMKSLLKMDPKERITAEEAFNHPYFDGIKEKDEEYTVSKATSSRKNLENSESSRIMNNKSFFLLIKNNNIKLLFIEKKSYLQKILCLNQIQKTIIHC